MNQTPSQPPPGQTGAFVGTPPGVPPLTERLNTIDSLLRDSETALGGAKDKIEGVGDHPPTTHEEPSPSGVDGLISCILARAERLANASVNLVNRL